MEGLEQGPVVLRRVFPRRSSAAPGDARPIGTGGCHADRPSEEGASRSGGTCAVPPERQHGAGEMGCYAHVRQADRVGEHANGRFACGARTKGKGTKMSATKVDGVQAVGRRRKRGAINARRRKRVDREQVPGRPGAARKSSPTSYRTSRGRTSISRDGGGNHRRSLIARLFGTQKGREGGVGIAAAVVEWSDGRVDGAESFYDGRLMAGPASAAGTGMDCLLRSVQAIALPGRIKLLGRLGSALGHAGRVKILVKLLEGPATYGTLVKVTQMKAGPLYHHVNQLRLAGLIRPKERDLYLLTRGGRNVLLIGLAMCQLGNDRRERLEIK